MKTKFWINYNCYKYHSKNEKQIHININKYQYAKYKKNVFVNMATNIDNFEIKR